MFQQYWGKLRENSLFIELEEDTDRLCHLQGAADGHSKQRRYLQHCMQVRLSKTFLSVIIMIIGAPMVILGVSIEPGATD